MFCILCLCWDFFFVKTAIDISVPLLILYFELRHLTMLFAILIPLALLTTLTHASPPLPSPNQLRLMQNVGLAQFSRFNLFLDPNKHSCYLELTHIILTLQIFFFLFYYPLIYIVIFFIVIFFIVIGYNIPKSTRPSIDLRSPSAALGQ